MVEYIKEHWVQYLIGATVAALLGLGLSAFLGEKWSTPDSVRAQRAESELSSSLGDELDDLDVQGDADMNSSGGIEAGEAVK